MTITVDGTTYTEPEDVTISHVVLVDDGTINIDIQSGVTTNVPDPDPDPFGDDPIPTP